MPFKMHMRLMHTAAHLPITQAGMIKSDNHLQTLTDAFHSAALGQSGWYEALEGLAAATGARSGQLIGFGSDTALQLNLATNIDLSEFDGDRLVELHDPALNPRVKAGLSASVLEVLAESDYLTPDDHKRLSHYRDFAHPLDIPFSCLTPLVREPGTGLIGLTVLRSRHQGHITSEDRDAFTAIAPFVRAAVRTQIALDGEGTKVLTGTLDALSMPAFICDRHGMVRSLTASAETLAAGSHALTIRRGHLHADSADLAMVRKAIRIAAAHADRRQPFLQTTVLRSPDPLQAPVMLDIVALPARHREFCLHANVLALVRGPRAREGRQTLLRAAFGLSAAEADVALQLADGLTPGKIAASRSVAVGTVRTQIKAILAKAGVRRQIELVARLNRI